MSFWHFLKGWWHPIGIVLKRHRKQWPAFPFGVCFRDSLLVSFKALGFERVVPDTCFKTKRLMNSKWVLIIQTYGQMLVEKGPGKGLVMSFKCF